MNFWEQDELVTKPSQNFWEQDTLVKNKKENLTAGLINQVKQGATFGLGDEFSAGITALPQYLGNVIGRNINPNAESKSLAGIYDKNLQDERDTLQYAQEQAPIASLAANVVGAVATGGLSAGSKGTTAIANSLRTGGTGARIAKAGALGATSGGLYGFNSGEGDASNRLDNAATNAAYGGAIGAAIPAAGAAIKGVKSAVTPAIDEGLREVGQLARKYKIPVSLDQLSSSRAIKNVQKISQEIPLSGQANFKESQMKAFNRALFKTVGVDADRFTPKTMSLAFQKVGGEFDALTKGKQFNIGKQFIEDLTGTLDDVESQYGKEAAEIFQKEALKVVNDFGTGDSITGELIAAQRARINKLARNSSNPNIKNALLDLEGNLVDGITSKDPAIRAMLTEAKKRYKNLIVLEPIARKSKGGFISPSSLNNRVSQVYKRAHTVGNSGDIGELARIGNELLPELGGSDTAQKLAYVGAATSGAINPASLPAIGVTMGANRAYQSGFNRNQLLIDRLLAGDKGAIKELRKLPPKEAMSIMQTLKKKIPKISIQNVEQ